MVYNCKSKYFYNFRLQSSRPQILLVPKMNVLPWTVLAFFLRRFIFISFIIIITANGHISTTSSKFSHVVWSPENKSSAIFQTKTIGRPPREAEIYSAGRKSIRKKVCSAFGNFRSNVWDQCAMDSLTNYARCWRHILFQLEIKEITCS